MEKPGADFGFLLLAWGMTLLFAIGAITLCALTLVEIAQRLVELGGVSALPRAPD